MKDIVSSVQSHSKTKCDSPKTPGGISKSLLTPIRRLGLSRNWKKSGPSPFVSPITSNSSPKTGNDTPKPSRKKIAPVQVSEDDTEQENTRKTVTNDDILANKDLTSADVNKSATNIVTTPRSVTKPRRHNSKTLRNALNSVEETVTVENVASNDKVEVKISEAIKDNELASKDEFKSLKIVKDDISRAAECKSIKKTKDLVTSSDETESGENEGKKSNEITNFTEPTKVSLSKRNNSKVIVKEVSPNNLTKECIVLIQKKINKHALKNEKGSENEEQKLGKICKNKENPVSQTLFDSDSDDSPLSKIVNKKVDDQLQVVDGKKRPRQPLSDDDDDFCENTKVSVKVKRLDTKKTLTTDSKPESSNKTSKSLKTKANVPSVIDITSSQSSVDEDDDFELSRKKTILIRKTYNKVAKPLKAKSTGSITQKDIDDLKSRIEMKKNMLLARAMTKDTDELRGLIKRWKKGCQLALMELMDLMKLKCPERQHMDYSEILQMLKIPSALVGYDCDNDCFVSPDDAGIILSKFNN